VRNPIISIFRQKKARYAARTSRYAFDTLFNPKIVFTTPPPQPVPLPRPTRPWILFSRTRLYAKKKNRRLHRVRVNRVMTLCVRRTRLRVPPEGRRSGCYELAQRYDRARNGRVSLRRVQCVCVHVFTYLYIYIYTRTSRRVCEVCLSQTRCGGSPYRPTFSTTRRCRFSLSPGISLALVVGEPGRVWFQQTLQFDR